ncbi:mitochondrial amidoxime-reducing component 1 isoform X2 [Myripristis murdjan]|uniref:mitochondrial amidoxime-reducing component 1 isoform X2 n=1 Tax=Myripristis murdjan TaxID=586833 RepID=UPI0011762B6E|nr:mitochondrial amidoxime-reducing component 1-like isoform X2 [Myripristis murdjan]
MLLNKPPSETSRTEEPCLSHEVHSPGSNMNVKDLAVNAFAQNKKAALLIGAGVAVLGLGLGYKYTRKPEKVVRVGVVSQLLVHPLKSGKAVSVSLAECHNIGLKYGELQDRHWLVITEDGHMVTGRQEPRLVLVSLTCEGGRVCLNGPDMEELRFPLQQPDNPVTDCRVFGADIQGRDCGDEASGWLTRYLGAEKTFRLVHFEPQMKPRRPVEKEPLFPQYEVAYPDIGPVMLLSEASVRDLSSRLERDVTVERFRPNIVVGDCEPFDEDSWEKIQIGEVQLQRVMSCGRCIFTTVDPETGVISRKEPLETLKSYRLCNPSEKHIYKSSPLFGQLYTVKKTGILQVGDEVYKITH